MLFSIAGGPDLTLTEVDEAARVVEACADENANIIYGQIIDEAMGDCVRITVIATGFKVSPASSLPWTSRRKDLFSSTATETVSSTVSSSVSYSGHASASSADRFADGTYIPDFLKRQR